MLSNLSDNDDKSSFSESKFSDIVSLFSTNSFTLSDNVDKVYDYFNVLLQKEEANFFSIEQKYAVIDIGGDDRGAFALGRYTPEILRENNYSMLMVINMYRPLTATPEDTVEILKEIESASQIPFTGLVNNSNLGIATTPETVEASLNYAQQVSEMCGLPVVATSCPDTAEFKDITNFGTENGELIKLRLQNKIV